MWNPLTKTVESIRRKVAVAIFFAVIVAVVLILLFTPGWVYAILPNIAFLVGTIVLSIVAMRCRFDAWFKRSGSVALLAGFVLTACGIHFGWHLNWTVAAVVVLSILAGYAVAPARPQDLHLDPESRRINKILRSPREINTHFHDAGLAATSIKTIASRRLGSNASQLDTIKERSRPGSITRNGQRYLVPRLVRIEESPTGPRAIVTSVRGFTVDGYQAAADTLATSLMVPGIQVSQLPQDRARGEMRLEFQLFDPLENKLTAAEFVGAHPASTPFKIPCALDQAGTVYELGLHHTFVVGQTGSGKGSVLQTILLQLAPFVEQRLVRIFGIDPKRAELKNFDRTSLFDRVAFDDDEIVDVLREVRDLMKLRQRESGRSFVHSTTNPLCLLVIDEFSSVTMKPRYKSEMQELLNEILSQGRSDGVFVLAAAQFAQKEAIGPVRDHFPNWIVLRVKGPSEVTITLGPDALDLGAAPHKIEPANLGNGFKTAGIGYVMSEVSSLPVKIRFPFVNDEDLANLMARFPARTDQAPETIIVQEIPASEGSEAESAERLERRKATTSGVTSMDELLSNPPAYLQKNGHA